MRTSSTIIPPCDAPNRDGMRVEKVLSASRRRHRGALVAARLRLKGAVGLGRSKVGKMSAGVTPGCLFLAGPSNPEYGSGENEVPVQEALLELLKPGHIFYDVGANVGFFTVIAATLLGQSGWVYSFEPVPGNFAYLQFNCDLNRLSRVTCVNAAVGAETGEETLVLAQYSGGAALASAPLPPDPAGTLKIATVALDEWVSGGFGPVPDVIKIDVEGGEVDVLKGMRAILSARRTSVIVEVDGADAAELERRGSACRGLFDGFGYRFRPLAESYAGNPWLVRHFVACPSGDKRAHSASPASRHPQPKV